MPSFRAVIEEARGGGAVVVVPDEVIDSLGGGGRIPVSASFDGVEYTGTVVRMGGRSILGVLKSIRTDLRKGPGDEVEVMIEVDSRKRTIEIPEDLVAVFADDPAAFGAWKELSFTHQREWAGWIEGAKRLETRQRRVAETLKRLGS